MNQPHRRAVCLSLSAALALSLAACGTTASPAQTESSAEETAAAVSADSSYASTLFDTSYVHTIDIVLSDEDWADLLANPLNKTKYEATVTIDGETLENVSFATKGNTSLSSVASDADSNRYSFKLNFGKFTDGQTYHGLDKLNLNNCFSDATYMKEYFSYAIFQAAGLDGPLTSYVSITVNGQAQGLYLAVEEVGDSYLERTDAGDGELYKPETDQLDNAGGMGGGDGQPPQMPEGGEAPQMPEGGEAPQMPEDGEAPQMPEDGEAPQMPEDGEAPQMPEGGETPQMPEGGETPQMPEGGETPQMPDAANETDQSRGKNDGGFGRGGQDNGASLKYTDDELSSYSDLFDNAETDATEEDEQRLVEALKALSQGDDLESCLNTDEVIRYFAAHNFVMNYDSYTGTMLHNYFLYEDDGKLSMLPWDYNLAFGTFMGGTDAASVVNCGIDTPLSGAEESDRPMWSWIVENETYLQEYHEVYDTLLKNYFESGEFEAEIQRVYEMILPYVESDPTAFYTVDEFTAGYETLKEFCLLRAESIRAQLDGTLSTDSDQQNADTQIDASDLVLSVMGTQGGEKGGNTKGGNGGPFGGGQPDGTPPAGEENNSAL